MDKIAAGSTVEDTIGANFDFVNDPAKISLTANDEKLSPEKIDATTYGFGKKSDGTYRFTLKYQAGENEKLILTLNEAAAPSRPVVLEPDFCRTNRLFALCELGKRPCFQ